MIEQPIGSIRSGVSANGEPWQTKFLYPYGYIKNTKGTDGEGVDCFIGPDKDSDKVFVIHQTNGNGSYDEDKVMLAFSNLNAARDAYLAHFNTQGYLGEIIEMSLFEFKQKLLSAGQTGQAIDGGEGSGVKGHKTEQLEKLQARKSDIDKRLEEIKQNRIRMKARLKELSLMQ